MIDISSKKNTDRKAAVEGRIFLNPSVITAIKNKKIPIGNCIMPKEGIFAQVLKGGIIKPGDKLEVIE